VTLNHIHFRAENPALTRAFYEKYFGFEFLRDLRGTIVLRNPGRFLLAIDPASEAAPATAGFHFGFCLETRDEVTHLYRQMRDEKVDFSQDLRVLGPGAVSFYCFDPAGNRVEVGWYQALNFHENRQGFTEGTTEAR